MSTKAAMTLACGDPEVYQYFNNTTTNYVPTTTTQACVGGVSSGTYWMTYPSYNYCYQVPDKTKAAFAVAKKLLKSKFIKAEKIQEFVELVEMIEKEL